MLLSRSAAGIAQWRSVECRRFIRATASSPSGAPFSERRNSQRAWSSAPKQRAAVAAAGSKGDPSISVVKTTLQPVGSSGNDSSDNGDGPEKDDTRFGWLMFWVASAVAFGAGVWHFEGAVKAQEFFAGYLLEQALSIDNLFVFILVFKYFKTPPQGQAQVLTYGIATAAVLRAVLIVAGVELVARFEPVLGVFAAILLFSSYKLLTTSEEEEEGDLSNNDVVKFCKSIIQSTDAYDGNRFFTTLADGTRKATPLLLTLAVVEISDVVFAVDSIPAVFGVTLDPFIVYTSNIFAILSLRALYSYVSTIMGELRFLDKAVAGVLGFIGVKMLLDLVIDFVIPTDVSLLVVALTLGGGVAASLLLPEVEKSESG